MRKPLTAVVIFCSLGVLLHAQDAINTLKALDLYRAGKCAEAVPLLDSIVEHQPDNSSLRKLLASCLMKTGKIAQGRAQYKIILDREPADREAREVLAPGDAPRVTQSAAEAPVMGQPSLGKDFDLAEKLIQDHRLNEAEKALRAVIERLPNAGLPKQRLAEIYSGTERFAEAAAIYKSLAAQKGSPALYQLRYAQNLSWGKSYSESIAAYHLYLERDPKDADARLGLANVESWAGRTDESIVDYRQYLKSRPEDIAARTNLGNALMKAGQYADAAREFDLLQQKRPRDYKIQLALAEAYGHLGNGALSAAAYAKAADLPGAASMPKGEAANLRRTEAYAHLENKDLDGAAKYFLEYLKLHPESDETVLQVARAYSWGKRYSDADRYYTDYLNRKPADETALREAALVSMSIPDFPTARRRYELLTSTPRATTADYEALIHSYIWDGKFKEAQPYAKRLAQLDLNNSVVDEAVKGYLNQQKQQALQKAREYTAASRYAEAIPEYKSFLALYGPDREISLTLCRLYSWNKQPDQSVAAYETYLKDYPDDLPARVELANVEKWDKRYAEARKQYQAILKVDRKNAQALLGLAQISDYQGRDAFGVLSEYKQALGADTSNTAVRDRANELLAEVSPSIGYTQKSFSDSDGFARSSNTFEASFPLQGGLRVTPFYTLGYFHDYRQVDGTNCGSSTSTNAAIAGLNQKICASNGTFTGNTGGVKFQVANSRRIQLTGDIGYTRFTSDNNMIEGRADLIFRPSTDHVLDLGYVHGSPIYDLNTVGVVAAGITGNSLMLSFQQPLAEKWRLWTYAGISRYSSGFDAQFTRNTQPRLSAKIDRQVLPGFTAGYEMRITGFANETPLYFSPQLYQAYGLVYSWSHPITKNFRLTADGNVDLSRITRNNQAISSLEIAVVPALEWHVRPDLVFRLGYRFSRGSSSAVGSPVYSTGGLDFGLNKSLMQPLTDFDPNILNVH